VLGLAGVELAPRPLGFELGALERETLAFEALLVLVLELLDGLAGGAQPGRADRFQERFGNGLVDPVPAERLAARWGVMEHMAADAGIASDAPAGARIGDLHAPPAAPAADQPLQQRCALAGGAAALAARPHVLAQPRARAQVLRPGHIPGMVLGQADRPLLERQLDGLGPHPTVGVEAFLGAGAAEHKRARIGRVGEQVVHRPIAGPRPADASLADRPPGQPLGLLEQLRDHLQPLAQQPPGRGEASSPNGRSDTTRRGRSVQRAGIVPTLPSIRQQRSAVSPRSVRQPMTSSSTPRSSPGASTSRTRPGKGSTT